MTYHSRTSWEAKLERADEHAHRVLDGIQAFIDRDLARPVHQHNTESTEFTVGVRFAGPVPLMEWGLLVGDWAHNLRSALDHVVYAIAVSESGEDPPPKHDKLAFPICDSPKAFAETSWRIEPLSDEARTDIERLQPYNDPEGMELRGLARLRDIDDADKHRLLAVSAVVPTQVEYEVVGLFPGQGYTANVWNGPVEDGSPFLTISLDRPNPNVKVRVDLAMQMGIHRTWDLEQIGVSLIPPLVRQVRTRVAETIASLASRAV